jgi:tetratricopeptide (TPR) repeat protein/tRNA A-37 threonylcarbamoyl transferase component Bud32
MDVQISCGAEFKAIEAEISGATDRETLERGKRRYQEFVKTVKDINEMSKVIESRVSDASNMKFEMEMGSESVFKRRTPSRLPAGGIKIDNSVFFRVVDESSMEQIEAAGEEIERRLAGERDKSQKDAKKAPALENALNSGLGLFEGALKKNDSTVPGGTAPQPDPLLEKVEELSREAKDDGRLLTHLGERYLGGGRDKDARRVLDLALGKNPESSEASSLRAALNLKEGREEDAAADAGRALKKDPANRRAREILAYLRGRSGQMKAGGAKPDFGAVGEAGGTAVSGGGASTMVGSQAGEGMGRIGGVSPGQTLLDSAWRKLSLGDLTGALLDATRAVQADPKDAKALTLRSLISNRLGNYDAALKDADAVLALEPFNSAARLERAYALLQTGRVDEALTEISSVLAREPGNALAHLYRGMALLKVGRQAEAEAAFAEAVRLDPALRPLAEQYLPKAKTSVPGWKLEKRKGLWVLFGLMALLLILEGVKRVFRPNWSTTGPPAARETAPSLNSAGTLPPGSMLAGNYRIERELARGGMGVVYEATDLTLKRSVAVKQLRRDVYSSESIRERFLHEARLAAKLRHASLAQIFSVVSEGELYLIFEFVEGESLDKVLARKGKLTLEETRALLKPVCSALDYAHEQKVIHRDLKPANIMLSRDGRPKLMDFGIAHESRTASVETRTEAWGTPPYMAPEQESGVVSRLSDLYSLGVVAYELLAGQRPFPNSGSWGDKLSGRFIAPSGHGLPPELDAVFQRALSPDPSKRFPSAAAFLDALSGRQVTPGR